LLAAILVFRCREKDAADEVARLSQKATQAGPELTSLTAESAKIRSELAQAQDPRQKQELEQRLAALAAEKEAAVRAAQDAQQDLKNAPKTSDNAALLKQLSDLQATNRKLQGERTSCSRATTAFRA